MNFFKPKKLPLRDYLLYALIILGGAGIDRLTKFLAVKYLEPIPTCPLIEGVLHLTYVENTGAAFGMMQNNRLPFLIVSGVLLVLMPLYLFFGKAENHLYGVSVAMITAGDLGNMIERVGQGYVVDFIDFRLIDFAVFNGADSFICVGAGLLCLALILDIVKEEKKLRAEKRAEKSDEE